MLPAAISSAEPCRSWLPMTGMSLSDSKSNLGHDSSHHVRSSVLLPCRSLKRIMGINFLIKDNEFWCNSIHTSKYVDGVVWTEDQERALCGHEVILGTLLNLTKSQ
jgi:hypothetical protein